MFICVPFIFQIFPRIAIAIAIGVLTSNRGGGRRTTLADWTWHQGAIVGCHCSAMVGGEGDDQLWGSGRGAIAGCPWHPTQQWHPEKASRKTALSFLQTLHCSLH